MNSRTLVGACAFVAIVVHLGAGVAIAQPRRPEPRFRDGEAAWIELPHATPQQQAEFARIAGLEPSHRSVTQPSTSGRALSDRPAVRAAVRTIGMELGRGALTDRTFMMLAVVVSGINDCEY